MPMVGEMLRRGRPSPSFPRDWPPLIKTSANADSDHPVKEFADRRVFVGGEVNSPGMQPLIGTQTALGAVMEAGGFKGVGGARRVGRHPQGRRRQTAPDPPVDENAIRQGPEAASFRLQPLDVVLVAEWASPAPDGRRSACAQAASVR